MHAYLCDLVAVFEGETLKAKAPIFNFARFSSSKASQTNLITTFMSALAAKYSEEKNCIVNEINGIALLKKCIGYSKLPKGIRKFAKHADNPLKAYCTIKSGEKMIRNVFANSAVTKLIVNVANSTHTTVLIVEKIDRSYAYTTYNPNYNEFMKLTAMVCKAINPAASKNRTLRCVTGPKNNYYGLCLAMSWRVIYACFTGKEDIDEYATHFTYDFIKRKRV